MTVAQAVASIARGGAYPFKISDSGGWAYNMPSEPTTAEMEDAVTQAVQAVLGTKGLLVRAGRVRPGELLFARSTPSDAVDGFLFADGTPAERDDAIEALQVVLEEGLPWALILAVDWDEDTASGELSISVTFTPRVDAQRRPLTASVPVRAAPAAGA
jgi:hypothetical protein